MLASTKFFDPFGTDSLFTATKRALRDACPQPLLNWREARFYANYGEVELHLLDILCRRHRNSIDVGANDGSYVHFLRRYSRSVHAFEPMPALADALEAKFPHRNVIVHRAALSRRAGTAELRMPIVDGVVVTGCSTISDDASAAYPAHRDVAVPMHRLDDVYDGDVGFIKIDVEGHQQAVLEGALRTIRRNRPRMLVEVEERLSPGGLAPARAYFDALSYRGYFIHAGKLKPIENFSVDRFQRPDDLPDLTAPLQQRARFGRYIYNFIFLSSEEVRTTASKISARLAKL